MHDIISVQSPKLKPLFQTPSSGAIGALRINNNFRNNLCHVLYVMFVSYLKE